MVKLTPILLVEEIEPCLAFWVDRLGFQKISETREGGRLQFVTVQKGQVEIMYQTKQSREADLPGLAELSRPSSTILRCEVENLEDYEHLLEGVELLIPMRETSYGSAEFLIREPAGNVIIITAKAGY